MTPKQIMMTRDLLYAENDLGNPSFEWNGNDYPCIPSAPTLQLKLEEGGNSQVSNVTMTVRIFNKDGSYVFPDNVIPAINNSISIYGQQFTIQQANPNVIGACFEIVADDPYKGI